MDVDNLSNHVNLMFLSLTFSLNLFSPLLIAALSTTTGIRARFTMTGVLSAKFEVVKFDRTGNFGLWQRRVKDLLAQQGMVKALYGTKPESMEEVDWKELEAKAMAVIRLCLADDVIYHVMDDESPPGIWLKLESRYMSKSLSNKLYLKQKLYGLKMMEGSDLSQHLNVFNQIINDLMRVDVKFEDEDNALMLLNSLSTSLTYESLVTTLMWGKKTLDLEEITSALLGF